MHITKAASRQGGPCLKGLARCRQWAQQPHGEGGVAGNIHLIFWLKFKVVLSQPGLLQKGGAGFPYCLAIEMKNRQLECWRKCSLAGRPGRSQQRPKEWWPSCCLGFWERRWRARLRYPGEVSQGSGSTCVGKDVGEVTSYCGSNKY